MAASLASSSLGLLPLLALVMCLASLHANFANSFPTALLDATRPLITEIHQVPVEKRKKEKQKYESRVQLLKEQLEAEIPQLTTEFAEERLNNDSAKMDEVRAQQWEVEEEVGALLGAIAEWGPAQSSMAEAEVKAREFLAKLSSELLSESQILEAENHMVILEAKHRQARVEFERAKINLEKAQEGQGKVEEAKRDMKAAKEIYDGLSKLHEEINGLVVLAKKNPTPVNAANALYDFLEKDSLPGEMRTSGRSLLEPYVELHTKLLSEQEPMPTIEEGVEKRTLGEVFNKYGLGKGPADATLLNASRALIEYLEKQEIPKGVRDSARRTLQPFVALHEQALEKEKEKAGLSAEEKWDVEDRLAELKGAIAAWGPARSILSKGDTYAQAFLDQHRNGQQHLSESEKHKVVNHLEMLEAEKLQTQVQLARAEQKCKTLAGSGGKELENAMKEKAEKETKAKHIEQLIDELKKLNSGE